MEKHLDQAIEALIVEDEIDICFLLTGILKKRNLHSTFVNNIHQAKDLLSSEEPYIMFLDNNLPDGFGVDFIDQVKQSHPATRIVMITADDTIDNKDKALHAGADFFIGKPFTRETINKTVDAVMAETVR